MMKELRISLRAARVNAGLTQADVAEKTGKDRMTINSWENGKSPIDMANFTFLCNLYGIDSKYILLPCDSLKANNAT